MVPLSDVSTSQEETDLVSWKEALESDGFLVRRQKLCVVGSRRVNDRLHSQAIQDFFDPSQLGAIRAFSNDLLRGTINASQHR